MSVFSLEYSPDNPVTLRHVEEACSSIGVAIPENEKKDFHTLLAVYHESMAKLMAMDGTARPQSHGAIPNYSQAN
jgi:amidase